MERLLRRWRRFDGNPEGLAGGFGLMGAQTVPGRIEESFRNRLGALPAETRLLLLVAAAEPAGDAVLVWRAAGRLAIAASAAAAAEADGLVEIGTRVRFRHPLVRSAVYRSAALPERRTAHLALEKTMTPTTAPAWPGLNVTGEHDNYPGDVTGLAPPGDIHRVRNTSAAAAISLHIYGTDVSRTRSSVHRY